MKVRSLYFERKNGTRPTLYLLDQRLLPHRIKYIPCHSSSDTALAIKDMVVRGAPAIGIAAAYGYYLDAWDFLEKLSSKKNKPVFPLQKFISTLQKSAAILISARPTAVNLAWAVNRMKNALMASPGKMGFFHRRDTGQPDIIIKKSVSALFEEAEKIFKEDIEINKKISKYGAALLRKNSSVLTHCNAGALATAGYGTALGIIRAAYERGRIKLVYVDETRPYLQGSRLTAWELSREKIPYRIITDNMAGYFMSRGKVDAVIVGADRIASNGDTANKIGTYTLSVLAHHHHIPFYVAAPSSTIDITIKDGSAIKVEERSSGEVLCFNGRRIAPKGAQALHPAFDITPANLISAIITEKGIYHRRPFHFTHKDLTYRKI